jgi:hypothetical protein
MPLGHLIALISNAHPVLAPLARLGEERARSADTRLGSALFRKTRIHQDTPGTIAALRRPQPLHIESLAAYDALRRRGKPRRQAYLLFTMSRNPRRIARAETVSSSNMDADLAAQLGRGPAREPKMVEPDGIEPTTSCLQSTRSPS